MFRRGSIESMQLLYSGNNEKNTDYNNIQIAVFFPQDFRINYAYLFAL